MSCDSTSADGIVLDIDPDSCEYPKSELQVWTVAAHSHSRAIDLLLVHTNIFSTQELRKPYVLC